MEQENSLEMLVTTAHGIARHFGRDCEVCIHDISKKDLEHTIVFILNGHVTGRSVGDGASKVVLETLEALEKGECIVDHLGYRIQTQDGRILKSSSIFLKDDSGKYRWILGINYDVTALINIDAALQSITTVEKDEKQNEGRIPLNVNDLLDNLINESVKKIGKPPALMNKEEKIKAIHFLRDAGAFLITRSGDKVSSFFGISKFTSYSYIDQSKR